MFNSPGVSRIRLATPCPAGRRLNAGQTLLLRPQARHEFGRRGADLMGRILLKKMPASNGDLSLVRPSSAEFAGATRHDRAGFAHDEELRNCAARQKCSRTLDDRRNIGWFAVDRDLSRPYECLKLSFPLEKRGAVGSHLFVAQLPKNTPRQYH